MFENYINRIETWLDKTELTAAADCYSGPSQSPLSHPADLKQIERNFIRSIVPSRYSRLFCQQPFHLEWMLEDLFSFGSYLTEAKIRNLIETGILRLLGSTEKEQVCRQLAAFLSHQSKWNDNSWHHSLQSSPQETFELIAAELSYEDSWACASFLAASGYQVPFSKWSALGWQRWSAETDSILQVKAWWTMLKEFEGSANAAFKRDRWLDSIFNPQFAIVEKPLCMDGASCAICPLSTDCAFYQQDINPEQTILLINQIKTGDIKKLSDQELIVVLAGETWFDTELQYRLTELFPGISAAHFPETSSPVDEAFLCRMLAVRELLRRKVGLETSKPGESFTSAGDIYRHFKEELSEETQESFYTAILDNKHRIISKRLITLGTLNQSLVHPREVFAPAIQLRAAAIILIHNHPSGDPTPSNQDIAITQRLQDVGEIVGIKVLDHVIIGRNQFFSFVDENLLSAS